MQTQRTYGVFTRTSSKVMAIAIATKCPKGFQPLCLIEATDITDAQRMVKARIAWFSAEKRRLLPLIQLAMGTTGKPHEVIEGVMIREATAEEAAKITVTIRDEQPIPLQVGFEEEAATVKKTVDTIKSLGGDQDGFWTSSGDSKPAD